MRRIETIVRFCTIKAKVHDHIGYHVASDCICHHDPLADDANYREDGDTLAYIERAVDVAIARDKADPHTSQETRP